MLSSVAALALLSAAPVALAGRVSFTGIHNAHIAEHFPELISAPALHARDGGDTKLQDSKDTSYLTTLTLNGAPFTVTIDTGSSDLWIPSDLANATDTGKTGTISYAVGSATGSLKTADLNFAGYTVKDQVFMSADSSPAGFEFGIIGLGPNSGSEWFRRLDNNSIADTALTRIFQANTTSQRYITTTLGRSADDPGMPFQGELTIDEVLPGYEAVLQQPQLNVTNTTLAANQHWQTLLDADGFLVNGQVISLPQTSVTTTQNKSQLTAVFDNGFTLPQLPKVMVDAIYQNVKGATFNAANNIYLLPCNSEINVTFKFQGVSYPVHPLDIVTQSILKSTTMGCAGAFQPITFDSEGNLDMILGMGFLRNVYMLNSFGSFVSPNASAPYIQLLSLNNDTTAMHNEFVKVRGNGASRKGTATQVGSVGMIAAAAVALTAFALV